MDFLIRAALFCTAAALIFSESVTASVVFQPGKKAKFVAPGEEQVSDTALELYNKGQSAEKEGNLKRAINAYADLVRHHPKDALAPSALYRGAQLQEQTHAYYAAADSYRLLVERYPGSPHFDEAIEAQFRIGEMYLAGKKKKMLGVVAYGNSLDRAVTIFANIVRSAPQGKYTARAQFNIGLAREKQNVPEMAVEAYQSVVNKFPNEPVAADAQYQLGYIWMMAARKGTTDAAATTNAKTAFQDFLLHYPHSEKASQARANLELLEHKETTSSYEVAKFYDKQKYYRAAVIYYNEVIRQQPGSNESNLAKKRIDQLRAKVGEAALQSALASPQAGKKKGEAHAARTAATGSAKPGEANNEAPLPAADRDSSLPPPASLAPDVTTAPDHLFAPKTTSTSADTSSSPAEPDIATAPDHLFAPTSTSTSSDTSSSPAASASPAP
jgi:outer membrane protein assembly factor BamD